VKTALNIPYFFFLIIFVVLPVNHLLADSIYEIQVDGKEKLEAQNVIITRTAATGEPVEYLYQTGGIVNTRLLVYYRQGKDGKPEKIQYQVVKISIDEKEQLIENWKKAGHTVEVTDKNGVKTKVYNFAIDFTLPEGMASASFYGPSERTSFSLKDGESKMNIDFSDIKFIVLNGKKMTIILTDGKELAGEFQPLLNRENKPLKPFFRGIRHYGNKSITKYSIYYDKVKSIAFKPM
jgi:hypothetical protein